MNTKVAKKKLGLKTERYAAMTRACTGRPPTSRWTRSSRSTATRASSSTTGTRGRSVPPDDGRLLEVPGRKERKLYAVIEAFAQNHGELAVTDARYINSLQAVHPGRDAARVLRAPRLRPRRPASSRRRRTRRGADAVGRRTAPLPDRNPCHPATTTSTSMACTTRTTGSTTSGTSRCPRASSRTPIPAGRSSSHRGQLQLRVRADQPAVRPVHERRRAQRRHEHGDLRLRRRATRAGT